MKEHLYLIATIIAIFALTLTGAILSPTFDEQQTYLQLFFLLGSLLFIFSMLVVFASIGFKSFSLFLALFISIVMVVFGIEGALLISVLTYFTWGFIFAIEILLFDHGVESAKRWFIERYNFESFKKEYYVFYPMIGLLYILLEVIPHLLYKDKLIGFNPSKVMGEIEKFLK